MGNCTAANNNGTTRQSSSSLRESRCRLMSIPQFIEKTTYLLESYEMVIEHFRLLEIEILAVLVGKRSFTHIRPLFSAFDKQGRVVAAAGTGSGSFSGDEEDNDNSIIDVDMELRSDDSIHTLAEEIRGTKLSVDQMLALGKIMTRYYEYVEGLKVLRSMCVKALEKQDLTNLLKTQTTKTDATTKQMSKQDEKLAAVAGAAAAAATTATATTIGEHARSSDIYSTNLYVRRELCGRRLATLVNSIDRQKKSEFHAVIQAIESKFEMKKLVPQALKSIVKDVSKSVIF